MSKKIAILFILFVLIIPSTLALGEDILSNCNLSENETTQVNQLLNGGVLNDENILGIMPLANNCDFDAIPPSAWEEIMDNTNTDDLNISAIMNNSEVSKIINKMVGAGICLFLTKNNDLQNLELPSFVPFTYDTFNFYIDESPVASITLEDKKITTIKCEAIEYPDYELFISDVSIIEKLTSAEYPIETYRELKKNEDIRLHGTSFGRMVKVAFLNFAVTMMSLFS